MAPLRSWKELFLGERALRLKKSARARQSMSHSSLANGTHTTATQ
jgi:hypothetical protein